MAARFKDLVIDAGDHHALADWWCAAMGYRRKDELEPPEDGWVRPVKRRWGGGRGPVPIVDPAGAGPLIWVQPVPEPKTVKNRLHIDVYGDVAELVALGATVVRKRDAGIEWDLLADPEGNEFCVFEPR